MKLTLEDQIEALQAKCALLSASLKQADARVSELEGVLTVLLDRCGSVSPFAGQSSVKAVRQAGKFLAAMDSAKAVLEGGGK